MRHRHKHWTLFTMIAYYLILYLLIRHAMEHETEPTRIEKKTLAYLVRSVRVGASILEQPNYLQMTHPSGMDESSTSIL